MNVLITGAKGMLAHDVMRVLAGRHEIISATHADLDIGSEEQTADFLCARKPAIVINCAAYTNVDGCEADSTRAFSANADGVKNLARACYKAGSKLFHISTDYVFDGTKEGPYNEADPPNPLSVYGQSKLAGEKYIREILSSYVIIRTEWLYGSRGSHFVGKILQLSQERDVLQVVNDQKGSPTWTEDLARAIDALLQIPSRGIYHITNSGSCTWFDFARKIISHTGSSVRIEPISSEQLNRPAKRPQNSVLDCAKFVRETGHTLRPWERALDEYMKGARDRIMPG
jgi:dTDP-4-dehydrorhamnose reductase